MLTYNITIILTLMSKEQDATSGLNRDTDQLQVFVTEVMYGGVLENDGLPAAISEGTELHGGRPKRLNAHYNVVHKIYKGVLPKFMELT
jgi:hypothetical protein